MSDFFRRLRTLVASMLLVGLSVPTIAASAQTLPNHVDLDAHEDVFDASQIGAIRFLTTADFPPLNFRNGQGELVGFHIELAEALCAEIRIKCTMQSWPWEQLPTALESSQGDAVIAAIAVGPDTVEKMDFSQSYLKFPARFVARQEGQLRSSDEIKNKVAVREGSAQAAFLAQHFNNLEPVPFDNEVEALEAVKFADVDRAFVDGMRASFWLNENPDCCAFDDGPYFSNDYFGAGLTIAVQKGDDATRRAVNIGLRRLQENGKFTELYLKWFPVNFYD
ncbi:transporter substrate-binding domain-containing protein [Maritalea mediterranea]|uniref:Transporter substrate-binding domain-containing protein n=1 Tax=Maritalea mediterranea TaxID=2909667 RepID=A0ABS9E458_9HYPH|nr:transporter substrate-binding domain-containing protein [Maritalea mediterranea]MCF4097641.1 transporter substrate-binding domain-containing protein [Maritalea mediterranea]